MKKINRAISHVLSWPFLFKKETLRIEAETGFIGMQGTENPSCDKQVMCSLAKQSLRHNVMVSNTYTCPQHRPGRETTI